MPYQKLPVEPVDVVVIGCHPDDIEISAGGTVVSLIRSGIRVGLIDLTSGEPTPTGTPETRARETAASTQVLKPVFRANINLPNRYLMDTIENRIALASVLRLARPKVILAHYFEDAHPDHIQAYNLVKAAKFYAKLTKTDMPGEAVTIPRLYFYLCYHLRKTYNVSFILPLTQKDFRQKVKAMSCYKSQFFRNRKTRRAIDYIEHINGHWGFLGHADFGEAYITEEPLLLDGPGLLKQFPA